MSMKKSKPQRPRWQQPQEAEKREEAKAERAVSRIFQRIRQFLRARINPKHISANSQRSDVTTHAHAAAARNTKIAAENRALILKQSSTDARGLSASGRSSMCIPSSKQFLYLKGVIEYAEVGTAPPGTAPAVGKTPRGR